MSVSKWISPFDSRPKNQHKTIFTLLVTYLAILTYNRSDAKCHENEYRPGQQRRIHNLIYRFIPISSSKIV